MNIIEKYAIGLLFLAALGIFQHANEINFHLGQLDSVYMVENIDTVFADGEPRSHVNRSAHKAISTVIKQSADAVCALPLTAGGVEFTPVFERHAYGVLYALAPLRAFASGKAVAAFSQALAFVGLVFAAYLYLREKRVAILAALPFLAFIIVHPAWTEAAYGQFYPDRLFLLAGFVYALLVHARLSGKNVGLPLILLAALFAASINERAALMIGLFTLSALVLFRGARRWSREDVHLAVIAIGILIYAFVYMRLVQSNSDYGAFSDEIASFLSKIENNETYRLGTEKFLLVNFPYLVLAIFEWRLAAIAFASMFPNIFGFIGGAEKTGWSTHYHSYYFPFLLAAACTGYARIYTSMQTYWAMLVGIAVMAALIFLTAGINPYTLSPLLDWRKTEWSEDNALPKSWHIMTDTGQTARGILFNAEFRRKVAEHVPPSAVITTTEGLMPSLYGQDRVLHYYPLALASAEYAVLPYARDDRGEVRVSGAVSYLGADNLKALDACLNDRLWSSGYQVAHLLSPGADPQYGIAILRRVEAHHE